MKSGTEMLPCQKQDEDQEEIGHKSWTNNGFAEKFEDGGIQIRSERRIERVEIDVRGVTAFDQLTVKQRNRIVEFVNALWKCGDRNKYGVAADS